MSSFWDIVALGKLVDDKNLNTTFCEEIKFGCLALANYFEKHSPRDRRFYHNPKDCYDGLCFRSEEAFETVEAYILLGKEAFEKFCANPFDGDILKHTRRDVSCGNSSCLYIVHPTEKRWKDIVGHEAYWAECRTVDFLNEIFDVVICPYF